MINEIEAIEILNLRSFRNIKIDFSKDTLIVGQNDHGKSSIFKILNVLFNKLKKEYFENNNALPEEVFSIINPAIPLHKKARRIIIYLKNKKTFNITFKEANVTIFSGKAERGVISEPEALENFFKMLESISFIHIPSARDASSQEYLSLFQEIMRN